MQKKAQARTAIDQVRASVAYSSVKTPSLAINKNVNNSIKVMFIHRNLRGKVCMGLITSLTTLYPIHTTQQAVKLARLVHQAL